MSSVKRLHFACLLCGKTLISHVFYFLRPLISSSELRKTLLLEYTRCMSLATTYFGILQPLNIRASSLSSFPALSYTKPDNNAKPRIYLLRYLTV